LATPVGVSHPARRCIALVVAFLVTACAAPQSSPGSSSESSPVSPSPVASAPLAADVLAQCPPESASKEPVQFVEKAEEGQFSERLLQSPACTPIEITFTNYGALRGVRHNIAIPLGADQWLFRGERALTTDPVVYRIPPLPPGSYKFVSEARAGVNGMLEVSDQP
jgi:hypothetical protein